jgi:hypothetical protein
VRALGGKKGNGGESIPPEDTKSPFRFIGVLDVDSKEGWMRDMTTREYKERFFPEWFSKWVGDFYAIIGEEVIYRKSD